MKQETIKVNGVLFRGSYAEAYKAFEKGNKINMNYFNNGAWEPTTKVSRFIALLKKANIQFKTEGKSIRSTKIFKEA